MKTSEKCICKKGSRKSILVAIKCDITLKVESFAGRNSPYFTKFSLLHKRLYLQNRTFNSRCRKYLQICTKIKKKCQKLPINESLYPLNLFLIICICKNIFLSNFLPLNISTIKVIAMNNNNMIFKLFQN